MPTVQAAIYLRVSHDRTGEQLAVERQREDCRTLIRQRGWEPAQEYVDNSVSASSRTAVRPAYAQMVNDYRAGKFEAIVVWDLDRLTRQPRQLEEWIEAAEDRGLLLMTANGEADLSNDNGRLFARIKASVARAEVERKSSRQRRANQQRADQGRPHAGRRTFGYSADGLSVQEDEADAVKWAVGQLLQGESLRSIVRGVNALGVTTTAGNPWRPTELRRLLANPRHAGLRVHRGVVVGKGTWPAILDEETHQSIKAILAAPDRHRAGRPTRYLLSGIAKCGACDAPVYGVAQPSGPKYYCKTRRHVARRALEIDELVERTIIARLRRPDAHELLAESRSIAPLLTSERELRAKLDALAEAFAAGDIDRHALAAGSRRARQLLTEVETKLAGQSVLPAVNLVVGADDVRSAWDLLDIDRRREIVKILIRVTIHSPGRGARIFDPNTVTLAWAS